MNHAKIEEIKDNADIDRDTPQPEIHVEERRLTLHDFLKTVVKINGSDLHLQAGSVPMIRVDGRARFLDCPAPDCSTAPRPATTRSRNTSIPSSAPRASRKTAARPSITRARWTAPTAALAWPASEPTSSTAAKSLRSRCGESLRRSPISTS